jgi:hypothetical protein
MLGVKAAMEEDELEKLLGKDPVHMTGDGFLALAVGTLKMIESRRTLFLGEKREKAESMDVEGKEVGGWARQNHEWLFETVSGVGGWKAEKEAKAKIKNPRFTKGGGPEQLHQVKMVRDTC